MHWIFLAAVLAAIALIYLGSQSVWVIVLAMLAKTLAAVVAALVLGIVAYALWRSYRNYRKARTPRLIFKR